MKNADAAPWADETQALPEGRTCSDCVHFDACEAFDEVLPESIACGFSPGIFQEKGVEK